MNLERRGMPENHADRLPARAVLRDDGLYLALRDIGTEHLRDAFMQETIARLPAADSFVQIARDDLGKTTTDTAPAGLIFHVARCGSTLISQLLKQHGDVVVYAEPLPFNELLLPPRTRPRHEVVAALRSLGDAFARHARRPYVVKFSSWNTLYCDLVAEAFPNTPWILSLRDPVEVAVSLLRQPAGWMQGEAGPGAELRRHVDPAAASRSPEEFAARLYGEFCEAAARLDPARGRLVRYEHLPAAVWEVVAPHFSLAVDAGRRERMAQAARINSKAPVDKATEYSSDAASKQAAASPALRQAIDALARPALERLEARHGALHTSARNVHSREP
jgi:hypothetical protein